MGAAGMRRDWLGWLVGWTDYSFIWELIFQFVREPRGAAHCLSTFGWVLIKIVTFIIVISPTYSLPTAGTRATTRSIQQMTTPLSSLYSNWLQFAREVQSSILPGSICWWLCWWVSKCWKRQDSGEKWRLGSSKLLCYRLETLGRKLPEISPEKHATQITFVTRSSSQVKTLSALNWDISAVSGLSASFLEVTQLKVSERTWPLCLQKY